MRVLPTGLPGNSHPCPFFCLNECFSSIVLLHFCLTAALFQYTIIYFFIFKQLLFAILSVCCDTQYFTKNLFLLSSWGNIHQKIQSWWWNYSFRSNAKITLQYCQFEFQKRLYQLIMLTVLVKYAIIIIWRKQLALRIYSRHVSYI